MRRTRTQLGLLLTLSVCWTLLSGCQSLSSSSSEGAPAPPPRLQRIIESGELRVGLTGNQPPLNMKNKQGELIGLEIDMVGALAEAMEIEARYVTMKFADLLPALERGELDMVASGLTITPERNARVAFAGPYFITGKSVLSKSETITSVERPSDLDDADRTYAALEGSTSERFVRESLPNAKLITTADYDTAIQMVIDGEVDGMVGDYQVCVLAVWRNPEIPLNALLTPFTVEPLGIALPADAPLLVNLVENYLDALDYTGLLTRFKAKWLSEGDWVDELP